MNKQGKKALRVMLMVMLLISAGYTMTAQAAAKAYSSRFNGTVRKGAVLTSVKDPSQKITIKNAASVTIVNRGKKECAVKYKNRYYRVPTSKIQIGSVIVKNVQFTKGSVEDLVNKKGYKSDTGYMIWISLSSQHVYVFRGKQGRWKVIRSFACSTGSMATPTTWGKNKIYGKQPVWYFQGVPCAYWASRISCGAFHTWSSGGFGYPRSHGCVRSPYNDAVYIYNKIPVNTTVYIT